MEYFFRLKYNKNLSFEEEFFTESLEEINNPFPEYDIEYLMEYDDNYVYINYKSLFDYYHFGQIYSDGAPLPSTELSKVLRAIGNLIILKNREQIISELI